ncbi:MAG: RtcB family protein [Candidatus Uhrbacteria bacterium]|nr:RtcB family protein [Patescibacteria group bacterium]MBU1907490.1 RtcB family protein [Patescibacteria group bacterium]
MFTLKDLKPVSDYIFEIPKSYREDMRVPARVFISRTMLEDILDERSLDQLVNVATLPGIERYALAMPDIHQGYGFPIGGVAAFRVSDGVISPGGVGYDINCGVRMLASNLQRSDLDEKQILKMANQMQRDVPSGVGRGGEIKLSDQDLEDILNRGAKWALERGMALEADLEMTEEQGSHQDARAEVVSERAKNRGRDQLGTLGAGNHFLEMQEVTDIFDETIACAYGLQLGQITVMIHCGSRGLGHQNCTDYVRKMNQAMPEHNIKIPDRELSCVPFRSSAGQRYYASMAASANFAWTNRQVIAHLVRGAWQHALGKGKSSELRQIYDVAHNMAKVEQHGRKKFVVHRKGATRAFGPGSKEIPAAYQSVGQPVLIPGSMGTASYLLAGTEVAMQETFGSCCHGAGRAMSRHRAKKTLDYNKIKKELEERGIVIRAGSAREFLEEAPAAYKDIDEVIEVVKRSGISKTVARMRPLAVIKG